MKTSHYRIIVALLAGTVAFIVLCLVIWTGLTQHRRAQTDLKKAHLQQIRAAVLDYTRDHPDARASWPTSFVAGKDSAPIWCDSLQLNIPVWDLATTIKEYLYQFPVDPSKEVRGVTLYYYQRLGDRERLGSCTEPEDFFVDL